MHESMPRVFSHKFIDNAKRACYTSTTVITVNNPPYGPISLSFVPPRSKH